MSENDDNNNQNKIAYLQMIQEPIGRMSTISSVLKGFCATIIAAVLAISNYCDFSVIFLLCFLIALGLMFLDIYYLKLERRFRHLYEEVRLDKKEIDFNLKTSNNYKHNVKAKARVWDCIKSPSIWLYYVFIVAMLGAVYILKIMGVI